MAIVWLLGIAGLLPMLMGVIAPALPGGAALQQAALLYGCIICAFMAGSHWGLALYAAQARSSRLILAIAVSLAAWGMALAPRWLAGLGLTAAFIVLFCMDSWMARRGLHDPEYWRLRQILTAGASLSYIGIAISPAA